MIRSHAVIRRHAAGRLSPSSPALPVPGPNTGLLLHHYLTVIGRRKIENDEPERLNLSGVNLRGAKLRGADSSSVNMERSDLSGAELIEVNFYHAFLRDTIFVGADMHFARFDFADLHGADFCNADVHFANVKTASLADAKNLTQAQLDVTGLEPKVKPLPNQS